MSMLGGLKFGIISIANEMGNGAREGGLYLFLFQIFPDVDTSLNSWKQKTSVPDALLAS